MYDYSVQLKKRIKDSKIKTKDLAIFLGKARRTVYGYLQGRPIPSHVKVAIEEFLVNEKLNDKRDEALFAENSKDVNIALNEQEIKALIKALKSGFFFNKIKKGSFDHRALMQVLLKLQLRQK